MARGSWRVSPWSAVLAGWVLMVLGCGATTPPPPPAKATDKRAYATVTIGGKEWMAENLSVTTFRNGDPIPEVEDAGAWEQQNTPENFSTPHPAWAVYGSDLANEARDGKLYSWDAVRDPRGLCPGGFRVPTSADWTALVEATEGTAIEARYKAAVKLKSKSGWADGGDGQDTLGLAVYPSGYRSQTGEFYDQGETVMFWASDNKDALWGRAFKVMRETESESFRAQFNGETDIATVDTGAGLYCRCIRE